MWTREKYLSYSQIASFTCPYRWELGSRRQIHRRVRSRPIRLGSVVHIGLAAHLTGRSYEAAIAEWMNGATLPMLETLEGEPLEEAMAEWSEIRQTGLIITERTIALITDMGWETVSFVDPDTGEVVPLVERMLYCPLTPWKGYRGIVDWVAEDREGNRWLVDWKVRKQFYDNEAEDVNLQLASYQYLLMRNGIDVTGTVQFQIRAAVPSVPRQNKDGSMSRAKIMTDWDTYEAALIAAELDPADYTDMLDKLEYEWWRPVRQYRSVTSIKAIWKEVVQRAAWDMCRVKKQLWRNMNYMICRGCWAKEWCLAELYDEDTDELLRTSYYQDVVEELEKTDEAPQDEE